MSKKNIISAIIFILLAVLTFYVIFKGNDMEAVVESVRTLHPLYLCAAVATAFFFVSAEGFMICYLLRALNYKTSAATCVKYSFVGFFFSGITPSATLMTNSFPGILKTFSARDTAAETCSLLM